MRTATKGLCALSGILLTGAATAEMTGVEVLPNNGVTGILFGTSVGIWGDVAAVGAAFADGNRGSVSVYRRSGTAWPYEATLVPAVSSASTSTLNVPVA